MLCSLIRSRHLIRLYLLQRGIQGEGAGDSSQIPYPQSKYTKCGGLVNAASTETIVAACRSRRFLFSPNFPCLSTACGYTPSCGHSVLFLQPAAHDVFYPSPFEILCQEPYEASHAATNPTLGDLVMSRSKLGGPPGWLTQCDALAMMVK